MYGPVARSVDAPHAVPDQRCAVNAYGYGGAAAASVCPSPGDAAAVFDSSAHYQKMSLVQQAPGYAAPVNVEDAAGTVPLMLIAALLLIAAAVMGLIRGGRRPALLRR